MTPEELTAAVASALAAVAAERRRAVALPQVRLERPRNPGHGDWATGVALRAGGVLGMAPRDLARTLAGRLAGAAGVGSVEVAGPGFLNVRLASGAAARLAREIVVAGRAYGRAPRTGERVLLRLSPDDTRGVTGLDRARVLAVGGAVARVLEAGGAEVVRGDGAARQAGGADAVVLVPDTHPVRLRRAGRVGAAALPADLVEAVGVDTARYALVRSPLRVPLDLDVAVLASARRENRAHQVRYAYARCATTARRAAEDGVLREDGFRPDLLSHPAEAALLAALGDYPRVVTGAAALRAPDRVARYLEELAASCHRWHDACRARPMGAETVTDLHRTRLWLNDAAGQVLANGLGLLGVTAPRSL